MKIVNSPPGIEPGPSPFQAGVQPLHHGGNLQRGGVVEHPPVKWKAQVQFLAVDQQFSYDLALC